MTLVGRVLLWISSGIGIGLAVSPGSRGGPSVLPDLVFAVATIAFVVLGAVLIAKGRDRFGRILHGIGLASSLDRAARPLTDAMTRDPGPVEFLATYFAQNAWVFTILPLLYLFSIFPTGEPLGPRWNWLRTALFAWFGLVAFGLLFPEYDTGDRVVENPFGVAALGLEGGALVVDLTGVIAMSLLVLLIVGGPLALVLRYRGGTRGERTQIKWIMYPGVIMGLGFLLGLATSAWQGDAQGWVDAAVGLALYGSLALFPAAVVIAILRYQLFDIDRLVSRTVSYLVVVGLLGGVYVGGLYVLQEVVPFTSDVAVAASTLAVVALFNPFRKRMQGLVDRRFDRSRYEAVEVLRGFAGRLRGPMTEGRLATELAEVLDTTMHPEAVGVWLAGKADGVA